jgi:hypothetical protein
MCDPIVMGAIAVGTAGLQVAQGYAQQKSFKQEAENAQLAGRQALQAANVESGQIRAQGSRELGHTRAVQAASGVDLSSGSAADVGGRQALNSEHEAMMKMYEGRLGNWQQEYRARVAKSQGKAAVIGGYASAASTLLTSAIGGGFFDALGSGSGAGSNLAATAANRPLPQLLPGMG